MADQGSSRLLGDIPYDVQAGRVAFTSPVELVCLLRIITLLLGVSPGDTQCRRRDDAFFFSATPTPDGQNRPHRLTAARRHIQMMASGAAFLCQM
jgi:hypothetical protein